MSKMLSLFGATADDVVYMVLPLYHVMGLVVGILGCLELGKPTSEDLSNQRTTGVSVRVGLSRQKDTVGYPAPCVLTFEKGHPPMSTRAPGTEAWTPTQSLMAVLWSGGDKT